MPSSETRITTGQFSWDGGVSSGVAPTIAGPLNPQGLKPTQLAWANNCSLRAGGISPRGGWEYLTTMPAAGLFNSSYMFEPPGEFPYIVASIGGRIWRVRVDTDNSIDEITQGNPNPDIDLGFMVQGERFLIIQAGDYITNPLFWDGVTMRRSFGTTPQILGTTNLSFFTPAVGASVLVNLNAAYAWTPGRQITVGGATFEESTTAPPSGTQVILVNITGVPATNNLAPAQLLSMPELPAAGPMDYYMGRIWEANGRQYLAGDIVRGPSGSAQYDLEDSILKVTENNYLTSGGVFTVPTMAGNIRALKHPANLDSVLGEGTLLPMTRRNIYSVHVVPTRAEWIALSEPLQRVAQINFGTTSDRSVVSVNSDLYYQSVDGVRSHKMAIRNFDAGPGNVPESNEVQRAVALNNRALLRFGTGIEFDNRLLQSCLPFQTPVGVAHTALLALNFDLQSAIGEKLPPAWEGVWEGVNVLQLLKGDFGGRQRAFAFVWSQIHQSIELWELTADAPQDTGKDG